MICSRKAQDSVPQTSEKKKKDTQREQATEAKPRKQFKDYNFTPLNASIHEVLMEVRKDPEYALPRKITREPPKQNKDKYCAYNDAMGHYTEG